LIAWIWLAGILTGASWFIAWRILAREQRRVDRRHQAVRRLLRVVVDNRGVSQTIVNEFIAEYNGEKTLGGFPLVRLRGRWPQRWVCRVRGHVKPEMAVITCSRCHAYLKGIDHHAPVKWLTWQGNLSDEHESGIPIDSEDPKWGQ